MSGPPGARGRGRRAAVGEQRGGQGLRAPSRLPRAWCSRFLLAPSQRLTTPSAPAGQAAPWVSGLALQQQCESWRLQLQELQQQLYKRNRERGARAMARASSVLLPLPCSGRRAPPVAKVP